MVSGMLVPDERYDLEPPFWQLIGGPARTALESDGPGATDLARFAHGEVNADGGAGIKSEDALLPVLVSAKTAARISGVSFRTWCRLDATGRCPAPVRIGKRVLWRRTDLEAWVAAGCPCRDSIT